MGLIEMFIRREAIYLSGARPLTPERFAQQSNPASALRHHRIDLLVADYSLSGDKFDGIHLFERFLQEPKSFQLTVDLPAIPPATYRGALEVGEGSRKEFDPLLRDEGTGEDRVPTLWRCLRTFAHSPR
jgi:hypothetical protein